MFQNNRKTRAASAFRSAKAKLAAVGTTALVASGSALAAPGAAFEASAVTTAITSNLGTAVVVIGAFLVAVWTIRAMGLLKRG